jgi:AraC family transcriptional regulator of adaptative response / DNA-3-methyladenine glycosylase II
MLDFNACNEARLRRDPAADGRFFCGVKSTMIYCRPVCRVRQPLAKNLSFFPSAAAAEQAGYRPCLRCRPETAPFCPAWVGTRSTVSRAMRLIDGGMLDQVSVGELAERLGVGSRHLARLFAEHLAASPLQVAQTLRVQRAKRLLDESNLSIADIAAAAGFPSARRMNAAFAALYGRPPSALRNARRHSKAVLSADAHRPAGRGSMPRASPG